MLNYYSRQSNSGNFTKVDTPPRGGNVWIHVDEANKADADKLIKAYNELRERERRRLFPNEVPYVQIEEEFNAARTPKDRKDALEPKIVKLQELFPRKLLETAPKKH